MTVVWPHFQKLIFGLGGLVDATGYLGTLLRRLHPAYAGPLVYTISFICRSGPRRLAGAKSSTASWLKAPADFLRPTCRSEYAAVLCGHLALYVRALYYHDVWPAWRMLAMYHTAKPENRKLVAGLLLSAALTSFLTGITEPIEFSFLFVAPACYTSFTPSMVTAFMMSHILHITIGQTFRVGYRFPPSVSYREAKTNWMYVPMVGIPWFFLYYFTFRYLINRFNWLTLVVKT
jgi:PTS system maltose and glucose-specific IIC component